MRRLRRPDPATKVLRSFVLALAAGYIGYQFAYTPMVVKLLGIHQSAKPLASAKSMPATVADRPPVRIAPPVPNPAMAEAKPPSKPVALPPPPPPKVVTAPPPAKPAVVPPKPTVVAQVSKPPTPPPTQRPATPAQPVPAPAKPPTPENKTTTVAAAPDKEPKKPAFQPPDFETLDEITKNWTAIPPNLLSQNYRVTLSKDIEFKTASGTILVKAGNTAVLVGQRGALLILAPTEGAPGSGEIPLEQTNLKAMVGEIYESWKIGQIKRAKTAFDTAQNAPPPVHESFGMSKPAPVRNDRPSLNPDGSYPVLLESMRLGHVREITPQNIKKWGPLQRETIDGKDYWTVIVSYTTKTMFGNFDVDAQARIYGGKVEKWVYMGSGETVP